MKRVCAVWFALMFLSTVAIGLAQAPDPARGGQGRPGGGGRAGRGPAPTVCMTLACDVQEDFARTRELITNMADAMPAEKYAYKSTPEQRSFAEQLMHIVQADGGLLGSIGGKTPAPTINRQAASKADVMAALKQSFDFGAAVVKEFNDQQLLERIMGPPFMGPTVSRVKVIYYDLAHTQDIYGQMAVYLRLSGITPPASVRP